MTCSDLYIWYLIACFDIFCKISLNLAVRKRGLGLLPVAATRIQRRRGLSLDTDPSQTKKRIFIGFSIRRDGHREVKRLPTNETNRDGRLDGTAVCTVYEALAAPSMGKYLECRNLASSIWFDKNCSMLLSASMLLWTSCNYYFFCHFFRTSHFISTLLLFHFLPPISSLQSPDAYFSHLSHHTTAKSLK